MPLNCGQTHPINTTIIFGSTTTPIIQKTSMVIQLLFTNYQQKVLLMDREITPLVVFLVRGQQANFVIVDCAVSNYISVYENPSYAKWKIHC